MPKDKSKVVQREEKPYEKKSSVRPLEDFELVKNLFESLAMSGTEKEVENDDTSKTSQKNQGDGSSTKKTENEEKKTDNVEEVQEIAEKNQSNTSGDNANPKDKINSVIVEREKVVRILKRYANTSASVSRQMLAGLQNKVSMYYQLKESDKSLDKLHTEWLNTLEDSEIEKLETDNDPLRPSLILSMFDESGKVIDDVEITFKKIKETYPDKQDVIDYLEFVEKPLKDVLPKENSFGSSPTSSASGKGEEYVKAKIPKLMSEVDTKFTKIQERFTKGEINTEHTLIQTLKQLEALESKIDDNSKFENLVQSAYEYENFDKAQIDTYEDWQKTTSALIESLISSVNEKIGAKKAETVSVNEKQTYNTFLKKQDPPRFKGDCLDYMEFKRKWQSQVNAHKPPVEYELDLLKRNIPSEGKKKLYGVDSLSTAWMQLDKLYGDKTLICQKLKSRLKHLKPSSTESHEVILEINNEIEYLVKRLRDFDATSLLYFDNEYLNSCYKHLPTMFQHEWDKYNTDSFKHEWIGFMEFMSDNAKAALKKRARVESLKDLSDEVKVKKGQKFTSCAVDIEKAEGSEGGGGSSQKQKEKFNEMKKKVGVCKVCKEVHVFQSRWMKSSLPSDRFINCPKFKNMTAKARGETLQKFSSCSRCTSWSHKKEECKIPSVSCKEQIDGSQCGKDHSRLVCGSGLAYCTSLNVKTVGVLNVSHIDGSLPTISYLQDLIVDCKGKQVDARVFWDTGSNRMLVNNDFAKENKMPSTPATIRMKTAGGVEQRLDVKIYEMGLVERSGRIHSVWGYGINSIVEPDEPVDPSSIRHLFPHIPAEVFEKLENRRLDLLIGLNYNGLFPAGGLGRNCRGNLRVMHTRFGNTGYILGGSHEKLRSVKPKYSDEAIAMMTAAKVECIPKVSTVDVDLEVERKITVLKVTTEPMLTPEYWEKDNLSILPPRRCNKCKQCALKGECSEKHLIHTLEEEEDLNAIEENVEVKDGVTYVKYPFKKDPSCLPYNRNTAVNVADKLWKVLKKDNLLDAYNDEIKKYMDRGTFVVLGKQEMSDYAGPVQYITHHGVLKDSATTPLRVVTNSSFKNGKYSLNDCLPKGPNSLNDMLELTVRFRTHNRVFVYDLAKAYNTMQTGMVERHLRRFIWKLTEDSPWVDFAIDKVHFGDRPAACQLEVSKRKIAELGRDIDPQAAACLTEDTYVDDGLCGGDDKDIERMIGSKDADGNYEGTIPRILSLGGFKVKEFVVEGDMNQSDDNLLNNSVFGYKWNPKGKDLKLVFSLNLSKKKRSVRSLPNLTEKDLCGLKDIKMCKRNLLGLTNSFNTDFLGMADPFTIRFKLLMRNLYDQETPLAWDDPISAQEKEAWILLISEAVQAGEHVFPRKTRPDNAIGGPGVPGFGDGAFLAFGGCVYLVWEYACPGKDSCDSEYCRGDEGGHFAAFLVLAKGKVSPLYGLTIPRVEMNGGVVTSRLNLRVCNALRRTNHSPRYSIILLDSECTICTLEASATSLKPYFHSRRAEILENMDEISKICTMEPVHWVASADNPADLLTRGTAKLQDISPGSMWQVGPKFLCLPREKWPVNRDCIATKSQKIPSNEMRERWTFHRPVNVAIAHTRGLQHLNFDIKLYRMVRDLLNGNNDYDSRKRVLARLMKAWSVEGDRDAIKANLSRADLIRAERFIFVYAMLESTAEAYTQGKLNSLMPYWDGMILVTQGRLGEGVLEPLLGVSKLPILMPDSRVAELLMWRAHRGHCGLLHRSVTETLARSRSSAWIVRGKQLAKKVCFECMECRKARRKTLAQQMGTLRPESSTICPPWTHICLDYAGPVAIKGEVNPRSRGKGWILVYVCRSTKAVCLLPTSGYDTSSFLVRHKEFVARKGRPRTIVSDRGTQLVKSGIILAEKHTPKGWDWNKVVQANSASDWTFVPVGAAHRNGLAEATVKVLKQSLMHALAPGVVLSYAELNTLLAEISFAINCRPLGLNSVSGESEQEDYLCPLTPNQLLLGRTGDDGPVLDYMGDDKFTSRLSYVSQVYSCWWDKWIKQVLPTLIPVKRWKERKSNLRIGDVVLMLYPGNIKCDYRLAKVTGVHPDLKGLVRTVTVSYRKRDSREDVRVYKSKPLVEEKVSVQRLSLLVPASE